MQLVIGQIGSTHRGVVLGTRREAQLMRNMGLSLFGYIDGIENRSKTLAARIDRFVEDSEMDCQLMYAWGWRSAVALSKIQSGIPILAFVDAVDFQLQLSDKSMTVVTPCLNSNDPLVIDASPSIQFSEPLLGLKPISLVPDKNTVRDQLRVGQSKIISILGETASPEHIIKMATKMKLSEEKVVFVLPESYLYFKEVMVRANSLNARECIVDLPPTLRTVDVLAIADGAWAPDPEPCSQNSGVLGTLAAAWEGVPLAVSKKHAAAGMPVIGNKIAWACDEMEVSAWLLKLFQSPDAALKSALELAQRVRTIASPARFIDGIQMRIPLTARFRS